MLIASGKGWHPQELQNVLRIYLDTYVFRTPLTKRQRVIACLVIASRHGRPINRFLAESIGDHCLNTTISQIWSIHGIEVGRKNVKCPTRFGKTDCKAYFLSPESIAKAEALLIGLATWSTT